QKHCCEQQLSASSTRPMPKGSHSVACIGLQVVNAIVTIRRHVRIAQWLSRGDGKRGDRSYSCLWREGGNKAVAVARPSVDETRVLSGIPQRLAQLADCDVDAVLEIYEG